MFVKVIFNKQLKINHEKQNVINVENICRIFDEIQTSRSTSQQILEAVSKNSPFIFLCGKFSIQQSFYFGHLMGKKKTTCKQCEFKFKTPQELKKHWEQGVCELTQRKKEKKKKQKEKEIFYESDMENDEVDELQIFSSKKQDQKTEEQHCISSEEEQSEAVVGENFKKQNGLWYCTFPGCCQKIGRNKGSLVYCDSLLQLKSHLRRQHKIKFQRKNNGDKVCFICPPGPKNCFYKTQLREHLLKQHKIDFTGKDVREIRKQYQLKECFVCQKKFQAHQLIEHYCQHGVRGKTLTQIENLWQQFLKKRSKYDDVNMDLRATFLSRLQKKYVQVLKINKVALPVISKYISTQVFELDRDGRFWVMALKNLFDLQISWPKKTLAQFIWSMLSELQQLSQFKFVAVQQIYDYLESSNFIEKKNKYLSRKRRVDSQGNELISQYQVVYSASPKLYEYYQEIIMSDDCFTIHDDVFRKFVENQKELIKKKMEELLMNKRPQNFYMRKNKKISKGLWKKTVVRISKEQALKKRIPRVLRGIRDEGFRQGIISKYWLKTQRESLIFRKVFFKKVVNMSKWERKYERQKAKQKEFTEYQPTRYTYWRNVSRQEAQKQLRAGLPRQKVPQKVEEQKKKQITKKLQVDSDSSQDLYECLNPSQKRWFEANWMHCQFKGKFFKDKKYRQQIMAYPYPQFYHHDQDQKEYYRRHYQRMEQDPQYRQEEENKKKILAKELFSIDLGNEPSCQQSSFYGQICDEEGSLESQMSASEQSEWDVEIEKKSRMSE